MYGTISNVKNRLLISDTSHDSGMTLALNEASRIVDEKLRVYMSYGHYCTLSSSSYTDCLVTDYGHQVLDDNVKVGKLLDYNNDTYVWKIETYTTIATGSTLTLENGTGTGVSSGASGPAFSEIYYPYMVFSTLPLTSASSIICDMAEDIAAGIYLDMTLPREASRANWYRIAEDKFTTLVNNNFRRGAVRIC
jgi:hypothetical protein